MKQRFWGGLSWLGDRRRIWGAALLGPHMLAFVPAFALAGFWLGGETAMLLVTFGLPAAYLLGGAFDRGEMDGLPVRQNAPARMEIDGFKHLAHQVLKQARLANEPTACLLFQLEGTGMGHGLYGEAAVHHIREQMLQRLRSGLRRHDEVVRIGDGRYGVILEPDRRLTLESLLQLAGRLQSAVEEPVSFERRALYPCVAVGFCLSTRLPITARGTDLFDATLIALDEALANGPSAMRAFSEKLRTRELRRHDLIKQVPRAIQKRQIQPWFQPQVSTDTGRVTGVEALARWLHPQLGLVPPDDFLPALEASGQMQDLGALMISQSLTFLRDWDRRGLRIPIVAVNLSSAELRDPRLIEKIRWELDAQDMAPERLSIEVLESVIADGPDGIISRNLRAIAAMGCSLELDDFGTGQASLTALRAFSVDRIKIDRSFVRKVDRDPEQQRLVAAIIGMAEQLELEAVAEGVESAGEHALLAQLGCAHVQGFGIARPMPGDQIPAWVAGHLRGLEAAPSLRPGPA